MAPPFDSPATSLTHRETEVHGGSGPMSVFREIADPRPLTKAFYTACQELGFSEEPDKERRGRARVRAAPGQ